MGGGRPSLLALVVPAVTAAAVATAALALALWPPGTADRDHVAPVPADTEGVPREAPAGPPEEDGFALWARDGAGLPLRWDACAPVPFLLSLPAPDHAEDDLREALAVLAEASGLELVLLGATEERPTADRALVEDTPEGWRWRPVLVAWEHPARTALPLDVHDRGVAVPVAVRDGDRETFVTGQVLINAARTDLRPGFGDRSDAVGATLLHEIAHVLGLAHVDDPTQIMSQSPGSGPVLLGAGDLAGLRAVGAAAGCRPAPDPAAGRGLRGAP